MVSKIRKMVGVCTMKKKVHCRETKIFLLPPPSLKIFCRPAHDEFYPALMKKEKKIMLKF